MKFFVGITNMDDARRRYRDLAKQHHPDAGGDPSVMVEVNREWDEWQVLEKHGYFRRGEAESPKAGKDTPKTRKTAPRTRQTAKKSATPKTDVADTIVPPPRAWRAAPETSPPPPPPPPPPNITEIMRDVRVLAQHAASAINDLSAIFAALRKISDDD